MSRYTIQSFDPRFEIVVGWDWPMRTYFAQVLDNKNPEDDENRPRVWIGTSFDEIQTPEELRAPIATYGNIPDDIIQALRDDRGI